MNKSKNPAKKQGEIKPNWSKKSRYNNPEFYTIPEAALILGVHPLTVYRWLKGGYLRYCQAAPRKRILIPYSALLSFIRPALRL